MTTGSLVCLKLKQDRSLSVREQRSPAEAGIIIGWTKHSDPIVFWNNKFPEEVEYVHQLVEVS